MGDALRVFGNGVLGVFAGMTALYLMMKLVSFAADRLPRADDTAAKGE